MAVRLPEQLMTAGPGLGDSRSLVFMAFLMLLKA
jgi:hypothetical protein